jgi:hypothetical protein
MQRVWWVAALWRNSQDAARRVQWIGVDSTRVLQARAANRQFRAFRVAQVLFHALPVVVVVVVVMVDVVPAAGLGEQPRYAEWKTLTRRARPIRYVVVAGSLKIWLKNFFFVSRASERSKPVLLMVQADNNIVW